MAFFYRAKRAISRKRCALHPRPEEREDHESMGKRRIGKMVVTRKLIARGSCGTVVVEGNYDNRPAAVKRLVQTHHDVAMKEIKNLIESDHHPNIVRYYGVEREEDFIYICLERCTCSLFDLITYCSWSNRVPTSDRSRKPPPSINCSDMEFMSSLETNEKLQLCSNGYPTKLLLKLMREIVCGLAHLHDLKFIHGDLKPQNILISKDKSLLTAKLSDMGMSKKLDGDMSSLSNYGHGSSGWRAPEQLSNERVTRATDEFNLGLLIYFCLTGGQHPFGESIEREVNVWKAKKDMFKINHIPEATHLISRLLSHDPKMRPKAAEVKQHPFFWSLETRLSFFRDVSDRVELKARKNTSSLRKALEMRGKNIFKGPTGV
ncbi:Endoribonuclease/protein kinase IRE1-like protein [Perilla frutescens var. hirtella]|nr:Endoribonuclease/protein kinase IRE1-like protein [Perilla frutescens var. hirtella]